MLHLAPPVLKMFLFLFFKLTSPLGLVLLTSASEKPPATVEPTIGFKSISVICLECFRVYVPNSFALFLLQVLGVTPDNLRFI